MVVRWLALAAAAASAAAAVGLWLRGDFAVPPPEARRELARHRVERMPAEVPAPWLALLRQHLAAAPPVSLLDPAAPAIAREVFAAVPWIEPASLDVRLRSPEGLRVCFRPRRPALRLERGGTAVAVVSGDGTVLPPGLPQDRTAGLPAVPVDTSLRLPRPGARVADPLVHEALRALDEAFRLGSEFGLHVVRIERQPGYPADATGVPPALSFVLQEGCSILWGRSERSGALLTPPLPVKLARLRDFLQAYPGLQGVETLVLDRDQARALDARGGPLP